MTGFIYFIQAGSDGPIKIGYSANVSARIADLQVSSPQRLALLLTIAGSRRDEAAFHEELGPHRMSGEWFHPHGDVLSLVARLRSRAVVLTVAQEPPLRRSRAVEGGVSPAWSMSVADLAQTTAAFFKAEFGADGSAAKRIADLAGCSYRTATNWLSGAAAPDFFHALVLMDAYPAFGVLVGNLCGRDLKRDPLLDRAMDTAIETFQRARDAE